MTQRTMGLLALGLGVTPLAQAQMEPIPPTPATQATPKADVVISSTRMEEPASDSPQTITVLEGPALDAALRQPGGLGAVLAREIPSMGLPTGTLSSFGQTLRGRAPLVLVDGVPQNTNRDISRLFASIDPLSIARIEVLHGPSALWGHGATGGVILITTRRSAADAPTQFTLFSRVESPTQGLTAKALNFRQSILSLGTSFGERWLVAGGFERAGQAQDASGAPIPPDPGQVDGGESHTWSALAKWGHDFGGRWSLDGGFQWLQSTQHSTHISDTSVLEADPGGAYARAQSGLELPKPPRHRAWQWTAAADAPDTFWGDLKIDLWHREQRARFFPAPSASRVFQSELESQQSGGRFTAAQPQVRTGDWGQLGTAVGLDVQREVSRQPAQGYDRDEWLRSQGTRFVPKGEDILLSPEIHILQSGAFGEAVYKAPNPWGSELRAGLRLDATTLEVPDFVAPLNKEEGKGGRTQSWDASWNGGLKQSLGSDWSVSVTGAQGSSMPDVSLLLRAVDKGFAFENSDIRPLKVSQWALAIHKQLGFLHGETEFWHSTSEKSLVNKGFALELVDQKEETFGVEGRMDLIASEDSHWGLFGSWAEGRRQNPSTGKWEWLDSWRISPPRLSATWEQKWGTAWKTTWDALHSFPRTRAAADGTEATINPKYPAPGISGFFLMDARISYEMSGNLFELSCRNLLNRRYQTPFAQLAPWTYGNTSNRLAPGRTISLSWTNNVL